MVKTLALGRVPRPSGGGLKFQIGSFTTTASVGTPGSFPLLLTTVRHFETRTFQYSVGTVLQVLPMGSTKSKYGFFKVVRLGSAHIAHGPMTTAVTASFLAIGE